MDCALTVELKTIILIDIKAGKVETLGFDENITSEIIQQAAAIGMGWA